MRNDLKDAMLAEPDTAMCTARAADRGHARRQRARRVFSAWASSVPSKAVTLLVQVIAIPILYRSLGPGQFAAYAAVTAVVWILNFLDQKSVV